MPALPTRALKEQEIACSFKTNGICLIFIIIYTDLDDKNI